MRELMFSNSDAESCQNCDRLLACPEPHRATLPPSPAASHAAITSVAKDDASQATAFVNDNPHQKQKTESYISLVRLRQSSLQIGGRQATAHSLVIAMDPYPEIKVTKPDGDLAAITASETKVTRSKEPDSMQLRKNGVLQCGTGVYCHETEVVDGIERVRVSQPCDGWVNKSDVTLGQVVVVNSMAGATVGPIPLSSAHSYSFLSRRGKASSSIQKWSANCRTTHTPLS